MMRINTERQHRNIHKATFDPDEANRIMAEGVKDVSLAERVAEQVGVRLTDGWVTWRVHYSARRTGSGKQYEIVVEVIDDHLAKAVALGDLGHAA
jgi:hypothetical protein